MISKYLKELIESNNRIIIPDFGAFMIQDAPEGKQISFNDFLKFNDGLLVNQIIKAEKISKNDATDKITNFIKAVEKSFAEKRPYEISEVGFLVKDSQGNIKFETKREKVLLETSSPTDVKPTIVLDEGSEKVKENSKTEAIVDKKQTEPVKPIATEKPKPVESGTEPKTNEAIKPKPPIINQSNSTYSKTNSQKTMSPSAENSRNMIIIITVIVIVLGGAIWSFFAFDLKDKLFGKKVAEVPIVMDVPAPIDSSAMMMDTLAEPMVIEEPEEVVEQYVKKYYIVAGSFKVASNAERYNGKLLGEGYDSEIVQRKNGFHIVTYKTLFTWKEALAEWKTMRETNAETWIFIK